MSSQAIIVDPTEIGKPPVGKTAAPTAAASGTITIDPDELTANKPQSQPPTKAATPTMGPGQPGALRTLLAPIREGVIGHSVQQTMPKLAAEFPRLFEPSTATPSSPEEAAHEKELLAFGAGNSQPGVEKGVEEFAGGATTAPNMLLMAGGPAMKLLEPLVGEVGIGVINKLIQAGFSAQMLTGAAKQSPQLVQAVKNGDYAQARQIATEMALGMAFATHISKGLYEPENPLRATVTPKGEYKATAVPDYGQTLDRSKAAQPEAEPAPTTRAVAGALPPAPEVKALPPGPRAPREQIGEGLQGSEGPGEKPLITPTPGTRIPPSGKAIEAGPTTVDPRELTKTKAAKPKVAAPAEAKAAPAAPGLSPEQQALELKGQIRKLESRASELRYSSLKTRSLESGQKNRALQKAVAEKLVPLRAQLDKIEPRAEAKPLSRPAPEDQKIGSRIGGGTKTYQQERTPKPAGPKVSKTPTYDRLPPEMKEVADSIAAGHNHLPQIMREANEEEYAKLAEKGTPLKEKVARSLAKEAGVEPEAKKNKFSALDFLGAAGAGKPEAQPLSKATEETAPPKRAPGSEERTPIGERRLIDEGVPAGSAERRLAERRAAVQAGAGPLMRRAAISEDRRLATDPTAPERDRQIARERIADRQAHPGEVSEPIDLAKVRAQGEEARKGQQAAPALPGMETAVREQAAAAGQHQGERLTKEIARPLSNIDERAGAMERESPLFRDTEASGQKGLFSAKEKPKNDKESLLGKGNTLHMGVDPTMVSDLYRKVNDAYQEHVADPAIEKLGLGRTHKDVEDIDPKLASRIRRYENAPLYFRTKAEDLIKEILGNLTPEKERLFTLMADADSRENLAANHPKEYAQALADKDVQAALNRYRPWEQQLTKARTILGGATLDRDYLRRIYDEHTAGLGQKATKGQGTPKANFDRVITPQKEGGPSRKATAEYHYKHGLHEFGPAFGTKFVGTMTKLAEHATAMDFLSKSTKIEPGDGLPPTIQYNGGKFYRPDVARMIHEARPGEDSKQIARDLGIRELPKPKNVQTYEVYDPRAPMGGGPEKPKYLGPRPIIDALHGLDKTSPDHTGPVGRFLREQIIGVGFGVPHVMNIMRRISHSFPAGTGNPVNWVRAARALTDSELKTRALSRTNDPTYDALLRWGGMSPHEVQSYKEYQGGNFNPANWLRMFAKVGHDYLFGPGGLDRRARLYVADVVKEERPDLKPEKISQLVNDQLGRYNRATWTEMQKRVGRYMLFPGWDFSSINWVLRHPIRTAVPPAILMMLANNVIHHYGGNRDQDRFDPFAIHVGHHSYGLGLMNESLARRVAAPIGAAAQTALAGGSFRQVATSAAREIPYAAGAPFGMTMPQYRLPVEAALGKDEFGRDLVGQGDWTRRGTVLPNKGIEDEVKHAAVSFFPQGQRIEEGRQNAGEMALSNLGVQRKADQPRTRPATERQLDVYNVEDDIRTLTHQAAAIAEDETLSPEEKQKRLLPLRTRYQELIKKDRPR